MKGLLINGSPRKEGNTFLALSEVATALEQNGVETRIIQLGNKAVQGCIACNKWNIIHGRLPGEAVQDAEGLQIMRTLGKNMAWLLKNIKAGAQPLPETEERQITNFIR